MATIKVYGYLNKPATKSHRFVILPPGIVVHSTRSKLVSNWKHVFYQKLVNFMQEKDTYVNWLQSAIIRKFILQTKT